MCIITRGSITRNSEDNILMKILTRRGRNVFESWGKFVRIRLPK